MPSMVEGQASARRTGGMRHGRMRHLTTVSDCRYQLMGLVLVCGTVSMQGAAPVVRPPRSTAVPMGRFPSGQRGQTVNLLAQPSKVRILLSPRAFFYMIVWKKAFSSPVMSREAA